VKESEQTRILLHRYPTTTPLNPAGKTARTSSKTKMTTGMSISTGGGGGSGGKATGSTSSMIVRVIKSITDVQVNQTISLSLVLCSSLLGVYSQQHWGKQS